MSALAYFADSSRTSYEVREVPIADIRCRIHQPVTLTSRQVARHLGATLNERRLARRTERKRRRRPQEPDHLARGPRQVLPSADGARAQASELRRNDR